MVKIRLRRVGAKKQPHYRVVVADSHSPRDGKFLEAIGYYDPRTEPPTVEIDAERALHWLNVGAQPSEAVRRMLDKAGILARAAAIKRGEVLPEPVVEEAVTAEELELAEVELEAEVEEVVAEAELEVEVEEDASEEEVEEEAELVEEEQEDEASEPDEAELEDEADEGADEEPEEPEDVEPEAEEAEDSGDEEPDVKEDDDADED